MIEPTGGQVVEVCGIKCHLPVPPPIEDIPNAHLPKKEQKWKRNELPMISQRDIKVVSGEMYAPGELLDWDSARREEVIHQTAEDPWILNNRGEPTPVSGVKADPLFTFDVMEEYRKQELERCDPYTHIKIRQGKNPPPAGYWIMINGSPVYLTPFHYFYCTYWNLPTGYPDWRWTDAVRFYHWQYVWEHERCRGQIEVSKRGDGKSFRAGAKAYLATIYKNRAWTGIQSKTDDDAKKVFKEHIVEPYKDLPDFLIPINRNSTDPETDLNFSAPAKRGKSAAANRILQKTAIRSKIDYRNSKANAYDGPNINGILLRDEEGKTEHVDVAERHGITLNSVYRDGRLQGKIASTTTVERWDKGGQNFKKIWDGSDPSKLTELGSTKSHLYKIWLPAYLTEFQDEFGFPDEERGRFEQTVQRNALRYDQQGLTQYKLQYPWSEEEMFAVDATNCQYNLEVLREREAFVNDPDFNLIRRGDFVPIDHNDITKGVKWKDDDLTGKWEVSGFMDEDKANNFRVVSTASGISIKPGNMDWGCAGFDPTKTTNNIETSRSFAGCAILQKPDPLDLVNTPNFVADYVWQPDNPDQAYLDILYACMHYGIQFLPESNLGISSVLKKVGINNVDCRSFMMERPEITFTKEQKKKVEEIGVPATTPSNTILLNKSKTYMFLYAHRLIQPRIIRTSIAYDPQQRTKYDLEVAKQLAIIGIEKWTPPEPETIKLDGMWGKFDHSKTNATYKR